MAERHYKKAQRNITEKEGL